MPRYTDPEELRRAEDELFARWKCEQRYEGSRSFLPDGAMPEFAQQSRRILFVLKEGNDPEGSWTNQQNGDLREAWGWGCEHAKT